MLNKLMAKLRGDFALVLAANIFSYFIAFSGSVIFVRLLGKTEFGLYTFAFGIVSLFLLVNGFGAASGVLQYVSRAKSEQERLGYLHFAFKSGALFNLLISLLIIGYALLMPLPMPRARPILLAMALFPVGRLYIDIFQAYLRATQQNKLQARFLIVNNCVLLAANVIGIACFKLYGLVYFTYLGYLLMFVISSWKFKLPNLFNQSSKFKINIRQFVSYSFFTTLSNAFSGLLFVLDTIIISYIVKDPQLLATYRVATIIPFAINFIPNIAVNYYYPEFAKNAHNPSQVRKLARFVAKRMFIFSAVVSLMLILLAKPLLLLIFGNSYADSVVPFQIISFGYWIIATFRTVNGNILAALGKAKLSFYLTFVILLVNIAVTYLLVTKYSIVGAASAIVLMYTFSSLVGYFTLKIILSGMEQRNA
ncbi:MAG: oligosaccharide flippase family protein [Burkholderiales bacterium]|jgi:O-antigen/teichoic acid export membrane protein|nr:oligosaccharide flippase family protein [Burkholderiales bacterium]MBP9769715.1 oligosaccharide flippase family protein [Burkholderiales bacterium]